MLFDLRYVVRSLGRAKGFTVITILTLALGIGSGTAIFSVVERILFRANPFPGDLYTIGFRNKRGEEMPFLRVAQFDAYREKTNVFTEFGITVIRTTNVVLGGKPVDTMTRDVSLNFFPMLGIAPVLGRGFLPGEDVEGRNQVVVISDSFWREHFNGSADALGRKIAVGQTICTVVGVLKKGQLMPFWFYANVYRPLALKVNPANPWDPLLYSLGRLRRGVSPLQAETVLAGVSVDTPAKTAGPWAEFKPALSTLAELPRFLRPEVHWMLLGAVGFLYGIACLNATNLMLVRMLGKRREICIRLALGCGRWRIIRLLLAESVGLCVVACAAGALVANWLVPLFRLLQGDEGGGSWAAWSLDWRALAVLIGLTVVTGLAIVVVPALRILRIDVHAGLKDGGGALGESRRLASLRGAFVVLQATCAVILLMGAGLMVRTLQRLQDVSIGFDASRRASIRFAVQSGYVGGNEERLELLRRLQDRLHHVPGVAAVAFGSDNLMAGYTNASTGVQMADGTSVMTQLSYISPGYPEAAGLILKRGRWLSPTSKGEIMINESLARVRYGRENPVGQMLKPESADKGHASWLVVGVVGDVRENVRDAPGFQIYGPASWDPPIMSSFIVQTTRDPVGAAEGALRRAIYEFDPNIVVFDVAPLGERRDQQLHYERFALSVLQVLAGIAIFLTIIGLFSVLAYTVDQRMGEFGVRSALGATPRDLMTLVLRRGMLLSGLGIAIGIAGALALTRFLQSLLYETPPDDPVVLVAVAAMLVLAALAACVFPATRAARVDVARLLKAE